MINIFSFEDYMRELDRVCFRLSVLILLNNSPAKGKNWCVDVILYLNSLKESWARFKKAREALPFIDKVKEGPTFFFEDTQPLIYSQYDPAIGFKEITSYYKLFQILDNAEEKAVKDGIEEEKLQCFERMHFFKTLYKFQISSQTPSCEYTDDKLKTFLSIKCPYEHYENIEEAETARSQPNRKNKKRRNFFIDFLKKIKNYAGKINSDWEWWNRELFLEGVLQVPFYQFFN